MKYINLNNNQKVMVDDSDFELLNQWKWRLSSNGYAFRLVYVSTTKINGKWIQKNTSQRMHRFIMNAPKGMDVDHKDGNKLNNTKENLRICTHAENQKNRKVNKNAPYGYKGVALVKSTNKYRALIQSNGKSKHIGTFNSAKEAAQAYNEAAIKLNGEYAFLNAV